MKTLILILSLSTFIFASTSLNPNQQIIIDKIISDIHASSEANAYTCGKVMEYSKGKISFEECDKQITEVNKACGELAKENTKDFDTTLDAKDLVTILVTCPIAKILGYEYKIVDGKPITNPK